MGSALSGWHWYERDVTGSGIRPSAPTDGPSRHFRARSVRRAAARAWLLHRRRSAGARRHHPRALPRANAERSGGNGVAVPAPNGDAAWPWPEPRLTYANAVLPEAMIAAATALDDATLCRRGLDLLAWLVEFETADGHLSPTPVAGRGAEDAKPGFDQQPIEVSTLADACARASAVDANPIWPDGVRAAAAWFEGDNDAGMTMWDPDTGGGYDGLHADGVNLNQGAESTMAVISTLQQARRLSTVPQ